jgi:hypothetical protein
MSKFTTKLERIYRSAAPPMGFRKSIDDTDIPSIALIADLTKATAKKAKGITVDKIDAAIINSSNTDSSNFKEIAAAVGDLPLGLLISEDSKPEEIRLTIKLNWDFLLFGLHTPLDLISKESKGKILIVEPSLSPTLVRAINELNFPVDAVLTINPDSSITMRFLLTCQLFTSLLNKPLLVSTLLSADNDELINLHAAGIKGLLLPTVSSQKLITEVKKQISELPKTVKRKSGTGAVLPHIGLQAETRTEKVEEEEEEEDGEDI